VVGYGENINKWVEGYSNGSEHDWPLAEAGWHHPDLTVSYAFVTVKLMNHAAKGITDKDFELALKIEEVIQWQPNKKDGSSLEGTPQDPRFKYIRYD